MWGFKTHLTRPKRMNPRVPYSVGNETGAEYIMARNLLAVPTCEELLGIMLSLVTDRLRLHAATSQTSS